MSDVLERVKRRIQAGIFEIRLWNDDLRSMLYEIAPEHKIKVFEETGDVDFGYEIPGVARFRANYFMQKYGCGAVFRQIPTKVLTADELGLPPILKKSAMLHKGLVLVTGPTGSGKSTTLAAVLDHANKHRKDHIVTIEDPIEFVHEPRGCLINHREVGVHTRSFAAGNERPPRSSVSSPMPCRYSDRTWPLDVGWNARWPMPPSIGKSRAEPITSTTVRTSPAGPSWNGRSFEMRENDQLRSSPHARLFSSSAYFTCPSGCFCLSSMVISASVFLLHSRVPVTCVSPVTSLTRAFPFTSTSKRNGNGMFAILSFSVPP